MATKIYRECDIIAPVKDHSKAAKVLARLEKQTAIVAEHERREKCYRQLEVLADIERAMYIKAARERVEALAAERREAQDFRRNRVQAICDHALKLKFELACWIERKLIIEFDDWSHDPYFLNFQDTVFDGSVQVVSYYHSAHCYIDDSDPEPIFTPGRLIIDTNNSNLFIKRPASIAEADAFYGKQTKTIKPNQLQWYCDPAVRNWYSLHDHGGTLVPCKLPRNGYLHVEHLLTKGRWCATADYYFAVKPLPVSDRFKIQGLKI